MRKIASSGKRAARVRLSARADARSRPNGFSTTTRARWRTLRRRAFGDGPEHGRWNGEIVERALSVAEGLRSAAKVPGSA